MEGADIFIGVSKANLVTAEMVKSMAEQPIIFAMANPSPEIMPDIAKQAGAAVVATGRSDFPNQVNNSLAFPGIFRGALDNGVNKITDQHKIAAAETINVSDDHGGSVAAYSQRWKALAARGANVRIVGKCQSACTVLLGYIPRSRICVTPQASFGFHTAPAAGDRDALERLFGRHPRLDHQRGGLTPEFIWMRAPDTYRFFKKC